MLLYCTGPLLVSARERTCCYTALGLYWYLLVCVRVVILHWASTGICSCAYVLLYCTGPLLVSARVRTCCYTALGLYWYLLVCVRVVILHWASTGICSCAYVYLHCSWPRAAEGVVFRGLDWQQDRNYHTKDFLLIFY